MKSLKSDVLKKRLLMVCLLVISICITAVAYPAGLNYTSGQSKTITGKVRSTDGTFLPGVTVVIKGTGQGTITDSEGKYYLKDVPESATIVFSFVGMRKLEIVLGDRAVLDIVLEEETVGIEEVVAIGYGTTRKADLTGAVSSISDDAIANVSVGRTEQLLQGRAAGVYVLPSSGAPGSEMQVRIRGAGTSGESQPLYIVDGMRTKSIEFIASEEIQSFEILKDAASAAIYGAEGANGVILITTKTGKRKSSPVISYNGRMGLQSVGPSAKNMQMNALEYFTYLEEAQHTNRPTLEDLAKVGNIGTNWMDAICATKPLQNHSLSISGGSDKSTYLLSGSLYQQKGIIADNKSKFDRYTVRFNSDHELKPWLNIGNRISYTKIINTGIIEDDEHYGIIGNAVRHDPMSPIIYEDGEILPDDVQVALDAGEPLVRDKNGRLYAFGEFSGRNPVALIEIIHNKYNENRLSGTVFAEIKPFEGLQITSRFGIDNQSALKHSWDPLYYFGATVANYNTIVYDDYKDMFYWQWENFATYEKSFAEKHDLTLMGGASVSKRTSTFLSGRSYGMFREEDKYSYHDFTPDSNDRINGTKNEVALSSFFGRLSYSFDRKYLFNFTLRHDGSSLLPPDNRWGTFPSVSLGWNISEEDFFPFKETVNQMKIRASWGQNGSLSNVASGAWNAAITTQNINYYTDAEKYLVGAEPTNLPNYDLTWETSEQLNIGLDLSFFNNQLNFTGDYFNKTTKDLIVPGSPPNFVGFTVPYINAGNVKNSGYEFEIRYLEHKTKIKYEIAVNGTFLNNVVTFLNPQYPRISGVNVGQGWIATAFEEGYPLWYFRGYKTAGIFQTGQEITDYISNNSLTGYAPDLGDPIIVDINKDGLINQDDHTYIGDPHPDFLFGIRLNLYYKGFDFVVFAQGTVGNEVLMGFNRADIAMSNRPAYFYEKRWTGPGSTNSMFKANTTDPFIYNSDFMAFDASFLRVRQLQFGYTFKNFGSFYNTRFHISLDDIFTFTGYPGVDPEAGSKTVNSQGIDRGVYPLARKAMIGLTFNF